MAKCAGKAISIIMQSNTSERPTRGQLIEMMMTAKKTTIVYSFMIGIVSGQPKSFDYGLSDSGSKRDIKLQPKVYVIINTKVSQGLAMISQIHQLP